MNGRTESTSSSQGDASKAALVPIVDTCVRAAFEKKAENIKILDLRGQASFTDFFVICSAINDRQVEAICESIEKSAKETGFPALSTEGREEARWVLLDFGDVVCHVFMDALRDYYDLEGLWSNAPRLALPPDLLEPAAIQ